MGASHHRRVKEILINLTPQRELEGRKGCKWRGQPVCTVWNGGGVGGRHDFQCQRKESRKSEGAHLCTQLGVETTSLTARHKEDHAVQVQYQRDNSKSPLFPAFQKSSDYVSLANQAAA
jgi:hypothetical protein